MKGSARDGGWTPEEGVRWVVLVLLALTVFFAKLGMNGMANFDDCFYAQKAKEILQNGNAWDLTFDHHPAFENPPLYMWMMALSFKCFGVTVFAAKAPSALMGVLSVLLLYRFGRELLGPWAGHCAALILTTTYPFFKYARHAMVDVTLTFFSLVALGAFWAALRKDRRFFLLWGLGIGAGILTKSVLGLFPMVIAVGFLLGTAHRSKLRDPFFLLGVAIALGLGCSWYLREALVFGRAFLDTHFRWLIFQRGLMERPIGPWTRFSYFTDLLTYDWPWLPLALGGLYLGCRKGLWKNENLLFLVVWPVTIFAVMSVMSSHALWYILPIFPALALWSAYALDRVLTAQGKARFQRIALGSALFLVALLNALPFALDRDREKDTRILAPYVKYFANQGARYIGLREDFYGLNNAMLFFSDHAAEPLYSDSSDVGREFRSNGLVLCLAHRGDLPDIRRDVEKWYPVKYAPELILLSNRPLDISDVPTGGPLWQN